jgi:hypothetical protein
MASFLDDLRIRCPNWERIPPITRDFVFESIAWHHPTAYWDPETEEPIELLPGDIELQESLVVPDIKGYLAVEYARSLYSDIDTPAVWNEFLKIMRDHEALRSQFVEITGTLDHCARFQFGLVKVVRKDKSAMVRPLYLRPVDCLWTISWDLTSGPCW